MVRSLASTSALRRKSSTIIWRWEKKGGIRSAFVGHPIITILGRIGSSEWLCRMIRNALSNSGAITTDGKIGQSRSWANLRSACSCGVRRSPICRVSPEMMIWITLRIPRRWLNSIA